MFCRFCGNVYTIEYQKQSFFHIYFLNFLHLVNQYFKVSQINKIIYAKFLTVETDFNREFIRIVTSIMFYTFSRNINLYLSCMTST